MNAFSIQFKISFGIHIVQVCIYPDQFLEEEKKKKSLYLSLLFPPISLCLRVLQRQTGSSVLTDTKICIETKYVACMKHFAAICIHIFTGREQYMMKEKKERMKRKEKKIKIAKAMNIIV